MKDAPNRRQFLKSGAGVAAGACFGCSSPQTHSDAGERQGGSRRPPIVDTHMHVWSDNLRRFPFAHPYEPGFEPPPIAATVELLLEEMELFGIDYAILVQVIYHGWDNGYVAECLKVHPDRFRVQGLIDPTDPARADKLETWIKEHGLSGMRFSPIYYEGREEWLNAPESIPLWEKAEELGAVFNFFISTPQLPRLEEMVGRFPGVRVVIDHLARVDLAGPDPEAEFGKLLALASYPNVWAKVTELQIISLTKEYPFADTFAWVRRMYGAFGPERLLWGTGFPGATRGQAGRLSLERELALVRQEIPFFTAADREKIMGQNAFQLWGFEQA